MDRERRINLAADAISALNECLTVHVNGGTRYARKTAIKAAEHELKRFRMACRPDIPFTWSIHSDSPAITIDKEIKATIRESLEEMVRLDKLGNSVSETNKRITNNITRRYLERFGTLIDVPELPELFFEHCREVEHGSRH